MFMIRTYFILCYIIILSLEIILQKYKIDVTLDLVLKYLLNLIKQILIVIETII